MARHGGAGVSMKAINHVYAKSRAKRGDRQVLLVLADMANDDGICWPSIDLIAKRTLLSRRRVQKSVNTLLASGEVCLCDTSCSRRGGRGISNTKSSWMKRAHQSALFQADKRAHSATRKQRTLRPKGRTLRHKQRTGVRTNPLTT